MRQTAPVRGITATSLLADRFVADLAGDPWIWLHRHISPDHHDAMAALCRTAGFSPVPAHWARSVTSQIAMVEYGLGVTQMATAPASRRRTDCGEQAAGRGPQEGIAER
ncbi:MULTISPECIES: LysR substrate-binding domain-containing protein [unclassified Streptomyces]|uniref:LysR substrate-binding domain-containing protein n=1 Tax=unclassified Streptomyces TaxID=2593676 RepID=UPI004042CF9E